MASSLKPDILVMPADLFIQTANVAGTVPYTTYVPELGVRAVTGDGREFRYVQAGASALVIGEINQCAAPSANLIDVAALATVVGSTTLTLTISTGTAITAGQFSGGYVMTYGTVATGGGQTLKISTNTAVTASGTSITFTLEDPIQMALTTADTVTIMPPVYSGIIQCPGTITAKPVGVSLGVYPNPSTTLNGLTALYYGWLQVKGLATVRLSGTPAIGSALQAPISGTAGELQITTSTAYGDVALNLKTGVDHRYGPVDLHIS